MRVLWVCNIMLPVIARQLSAGYSVREGWLSGLFQSLLERESEELQLGVCFPAEGALSALNRKLRFGPRGREVACYGFSEDLERPERYDPSLEARFSEILTDFAPDAVHIFGTEFPHGYACAKVFGRPERTLVGLQGMMGAIARAYMADLPPAVQRSRTLRDVLKRDSLAQQQQKFRARARREEMLLKLAGHVTGRTPFDRKEASALCPQAVYHFMNETLRDCFYEGGWEPDRCRRYEIFVSQADYPIKGFHYLLQAMPVILEAFPETTVAVAGNSVLGTGGVKSRLKIPAYGKYLRSLAKKNGLMDRIRVLGRLDAEGMKRAYLSCHVFLCPSAMENSPNSVGEAQLLGVPVAASDTGGIPGVVRHGIGGLLFQKGDPEALAEAVIRIFSSDETALELSRSEKADAAVRYDGTRNLETLLEIYRKMQRGRADV